MKFWVIIIAVVGCLLASVVPIPGTDVWYSQFVAVLLFGYLMVACLIAEMSLTVGLLFAYLTFSAVFITHTDVMALICMMQVGLCLLTAKAVSQLGPAKRQKVWLVIGSLLGLQVAWGVVQFFNLDPIFRYTQDTRLCDTVGLSGSHNQYGLFMAGASPAAFIFPFTLPLLFIGLTLSKTFSAILGSTVAGLFFFRKKIGAMKLAAITFVFIAGFFVLTHKDISGKLRERMALWKLTISQVAYGKAYMIPYDHYLIKKVVACNPLVGFGFQKFFTISPYTQLPILWHNNTHRYEHAHNDYVEAFFDLGIIGIILVLFSYIELVFLYMNVAVKTVGLEMAAASLIAYSVSAISIYTIHTAYGGFFLCVLLGLFYGEVKDGQKRRQ